MGRHVAARHTPHFQLLQPPEGCLEYPQSTDCRPHLTQRKLRLEEVEQWSEELHPRQACSRPAPQAGLLQCWHFYIHPRWRLFCVDSWEGPAVSERVRV